MTKPKRLRTPTAHSRVSDEELLNTPVGNLHHYGARLVADRGEAREMIFDLLTRIPQGKTIPRRAYAVAAWLLDPMMRGDDPLPLPFPKKRGRPTGSFTAVCTALAVQSTRRAGATKDEAIAAVAKKAFRKKAVEKIYERANKPALSGMVQAARGLEVHALRAQRAKKK